MYISKNNASVCLRKRHVNTSVCGQGVLTFDASYIRGFSARHFHWMISDACIQWPEQEHILIDNDYIYSHSHV